MEQKFEHAALEQDIERLETEIRERHGASVSREAVRDVVVERAGKAPAPSAQQGTGAHGDTTSVLPAYLMHVSDEVRLDVEKALDVAWHKGVAAGVREAKKYGPLVLDAYHDALTDRLFEQMQSRS